jgi:hypothetical protein
MPHQLSKTIKTIPHSFFIQTQEFAVGDSGFS